jgi:hypothetical protein
MSIQELIILYIQVLQLNNLYDNLIILIQSYIKNQHSIIDLFEFISSHLLLNLNLIKQLNYDNINIFIFDFIIYHINESIDYELLHNQIIKLSFILKNTILYENLIINRNKKSLFFKN